MEDGKWKMENGKVLLVLVLVLVLVYCWCTCTGLEFTSTSYCTVLLAGFPFLLLIPVIFQYRFGFASKNALSNHEKRVYNPMSFPLDRYNYNIP